MQAKPYNDSTEVEREEGELLQEPIPEPISNYNDEHADDAEQRALPVPVGGSGTGVKPLCWFFQRGICRYDHGCRYSHDSAAPISVPKYGLLSHPRSSTPCRFFARGYCRYGSECKFAHPNGVIAAGRFHFSNGNGHQVNGAENGDGDAFGDNDLDFSDRKSITVSQVAKSWDEDTQEVMDGPNQTNYY